MAEEKKKKPEGAKSKAETPKEEIPAQSTEKKNMKINRMTMAEIEAKLEELRAAQGGLGSKYAQQLLRRKSALGSSQT
jgi:hypothetical protein